MPVFRCHSNQNKFWMQKQSLSHASHIHRYIVCVKLVEISRKWIFSSIFCSICPCKRVFSKSKVYSQDQLCCPVSHAPRQISPDSLHAVKGFELHLAALDSTLRNNYSSSSSSTHQWSYAARVSKWGRGKIHLFSLGENQCLSFLFENSVWITKYMIAHKICMALLACIHTHNIPMFVRSYTHCTWTWAVSI